MATHENFDRSRANLVTSAVALEFGLPSINLAPSTKRGSPHVVLARQIAIYLFRTVYGTSNSRAARIFHRHPATTSHACTVVEEYRDDPVIDGRLRKLEIFLEGTPTPAHEAA